MSGELAGHCKSVDELGFQMAEWVRAKYLKENSVSDEDFFKRVQIYTIAQNVADSIVMEQLLYF